MRLVVRGLRRFFCRLIGHAWHEPTRVGTTEPPMFQVGCQRCLTHVLGDWDDLEKAGAWPHYRSWGNR